MDQASLLNGMDRDGSSNNLMPTGDQPSTPSAPEPRSRISKLPRSKVLPLDASSTTDHAEPHSRIRGRAKILTHAYKYMKRSLADFQAKLKIRNMVRIMTRHDKRSDFLIDPRNTKMRYWDAATSIALMYTALVTPYEVAYLSSTISVLFWVNRFVDCIFLVDIVIQFFLIYYDEETCRWIEDHKKIVSSYLRTWFILDVIAILPFDFLGIFMHVSGLSKLKLIRIIKLFRLAKLVRVFRAGRIFQQMELHFSISYSMAQLIYCAVAVLLCAHWMACAFGITVALEPCHVDDYASGQCTNWIYYYNENGGNSKLLQVDSNGNLMQQNGYGELIKVGEDAGTSVADPEQSQSDAGLPVYGLVSVYWASVYWAVMTMSTIGYGDVTPQTDVERMYVTAGMVIGAALYAYMVGNVCSIIATMRATDERFRREMDSLNKFLVTNNIPKALRHDLRAYYKYRHANVTLEQSMDVLRKLTPRLQTQASAYTEAEWISNTDLFRALPQDTVLDLCAALKVETFVPNEVIFAENTACDRLYILDRGVVWNRGRICACLPSKRLCNQWIGIQDAYSFAGLHRSPAHALTYCVVFSLRNEVLEVQLNRNPLVKVKFRKALVRIIIKESILVFSKAVKALLTDEKCLKSSFHNPRFSFEYDNWMLRHRYTEILKILIFRFGPTHPISRQINIAQSAAISIQATFRKMRAQQRTEQATRYEEFVRERMHGAGSWITTGRQVSPPADEGDAEAYSTKDEREVLTEQRGKEKILLAASAAQGRKTTSGMAPWKLAPLEAKAKDDKVSQKLMEQMMEDMRELKIEMADMKKILRYISSKL